MAPRQVVPIRYDARIILWQETSHIERSEPNTFFKRLSRTSSEFIGFEFIDENVLGLCKRNVVRMNMNDETSRQSFYHTKQTEPVIKNSVAFRIPGS
jgi:hypothetical protein